MIPILVYEGVAGFEALHALAALRAAGIEGELVGEDAVVRTREGARIVPARLGFATLETATAVVLPGGDVQTALEAPALARVLRTRRGKWTLASGNAIHLAARVGLFDAARSARAPDGVAVEGAAQTLASRLVADGRLLSCSGGDAIVDLVLHYVAHEHSAEVAERAADALGRTWQPFAMGATESGA